MEAALRSDDPEIARRAARVAFAAEAWQQAAMASDRWSVLQPDSVAAHESAAVAMLALGDYAGVEFQVLNILDLMDGSIEGWLLVSNLLAQNVPPEFFPRGVLIITMNRPEAKNAINGPLATGLWAAVQELKDLLKTLG